MALFWCANGAMPTTAANPMAATVSGIHTYLQIATPAARALVVVAFGVEFAAPVTAATTVELVDTAAIGATALTAHVAAGLQPYDARWLATAAPVSQMTLGTGATGYAPGTATEGSIVATRTAKTKILPVGASNYEWEWSQGREFYVGPSRFLRVRLTTTTTAPTVYTWVLWDE